MPSRHLLPLLLVALAAAPHASAQYQWRDANGRMVYSDMPPPASVQPSAVLRAPARPAPADTTGGSGATASAPPASGAAAQPAASAPAGGAAPNAADREMDFRKRRLDRAEAERKAQDAAAAAQRTAAACDSAREEIRTLESGMRMARINDRGEREVLDDAQRAARLEAARKTAREQCKVS